MGLAAAAIRPFVRNIQAISIGPVEQIELVVLDDADEPLRIVGRRGVARGLEPPGPTAVVGRGVGEERVVARLRVEEAGVVVVGVFDRRVAAEAFALGVVVVVYAVARPVALALDAEVVVRLAREPAVAGVRLQQSLGHGDAGRNAVALHVRHGDGLVAVDVLLARDLLRRGAERNCGKQNQNAYCFFINNHYLCN